MRSLRRAWNVLLATVFCWSLAATTFAARTWTDASGQFNVEADYVDFQDGNVQLRKTDGTIITVPAAKLSAADRSYLSIQLANKSKPATATTQAAGATPAAVDPAELSMPKLVDADDKLSRAAWSKFTQAFRNFDVDSDDALSRAELVAAGDVDLLLKLVDSDGDGKLIRAEWALLARNFARYDKNSDNAVAMTELQQAADAAASRSSGTASLDGAGGTTPAPAGPTLWRGQIEGRGAIELMVNGNQIAGRDGGGDSLGTGTFTMTGDGTTGYMDAVYTTGPQAGQVCLGIYTLQGDTLRWCVSNRPGVRPQDFSGGRGNWLMTLTKTPQP